MKPSAGAVNMKIYFSTSFSRCVPALLFDALHACQLVSVPARICIQGIPVAIRLVKNWFFVIYLYEKGENISISVLQ